MEFKKGIWLIILADRNYLNKSKILPHLHKDYLLNL